MARAWLQICFGCNEIRIFSKDQIIHCDIAGKANKYLYAVLEDYYQHRPDIVAQKKKIEQVEASDR